jgi:hypothetical protein
MKISLNNLSHVDETAVTLAGSIGLLTARNPLKSLYFRREKALTGESRCPKRVTAKGSKPCRELFV